MIPKHKLREIANRLLEKTRANQVRWTFHETEDYGCELHLPNSSIEVLLESPPGEPERIRLVINKAEDEFSVPVSEWVVEDGDTDWELVHSLHDAASRIVFGWDKVLAEVETAVNSGGPIGSEPN